MQHSARHIAKIPRHYRRDDAQRTVIQSPPADFYHSVEGSGSPALPGHKYQMHNAACDFRHFRARACFMGFLPISRVIIHCAIFFLHEREARLTNIA
ncbi:hypothetical protein KCP69_15635 [Salmonella enterica subsp. enterica]|nr:hypothetical protein KCP69_15635 [Salmonella enterica subsp. enterica]